MAYSFGYSKVESFILYSVATLSFDPFDLFLFRFAFFFSEKRGKGERGPAARFVVSRYSVLRRLDFFLFFTIQVQVQVAITEYDNDSLTFDLLQGKVEVEVESRK